MKPFLIHQKKLLRKEFLPLCVPMAPKNAFFEAMDCSMREATPKRNNDGMIYESSRQLHWGHIAGILDWITLHHMFMRADTQRSNQALQI